MKDFWTLTVVKLFLFRIPGRHPKSISKAVRPNKVSILTAQKENQSLRTTPDSTQRRQPTAVKTPLRGLTLALHHHAWHTENLSSPTQSVRALASSHVAELYPPGAPAKQRPVFQHRRYLTDPREPPQIFQSLLALVA